MKQKVISFEKLQNDYKLGFETTTDKGKTFNTYAIVSNQNAMSLDDNGIIQEAWNKIKSHVEKEAVRIDKEGAAEQISSPLVCSSSGK